MSIRKSSVETSELKESTYGGQRGWNRGTPHLTSFHGMRPTGRQAIILAPIEI